MKHIAIVGASLAGLSAARALRAQGFEGQLTVVGDEVRRPYDRPPLSKEFLAGEMTEADLALEADDDDLNAHWILGTPAERLDISSGAIELADGTRILAEGVVLATGSRARRWPGDALAGVHVIRTVDDALALRADLQSGARLVVIGAGFIGAEVASTARKLGVDVTVVEAAPTPLVGPLGARLGEIVARAHTANGTTLVCGVGVAGLTGTERVTGVALDDGRHLPADVVVVGIGGAPNIEWLRRSGLELGNGVVCGAGGETAVPNVVAVGDCAAWLDVSTGSPHRVEHWTGALERPAIAVATLLAGGLHQGTIAKAPYFWSDQYGSRIQFAGIARPGDEITVEDGDCDAGCFLATYRREGRLVAVLGVDQTRLFTRWRRQLAAVTAAASSIPPQRRGTYFQFHRAPGVFVTTAPSLPASLISTLPGHYYTDPSVFALEQEKVFEQMWFCAVRSGDLDKAGAFRTVQVGRESVLVTRTRKGELRAYYNVCRHRGARLCTEESGEVKRAFQCPYHAWTYDLEGKLVAAPNLTKMPDIDRTEYGLATIAVQEWLGYVWVCLAEEPPSFEESVMQDIIDRLGDVESIDHYEIAGLSLGRRIVYDVKANWKLIIENFMECYHCATIHPELTEVLPEFADGYAAQYYVGHGAEFGYDVKGFTVDGSEGLDHITGVTEDQDRRYYAITVRPTVFVNLVPDHVIVHRMFPMAADHTIVECDWLYLPEVVASGKDVSRSVELFHRVNQQDFAACERCQPAMDSRTYRDGGVLVPSEHHIGEFHDWLRQMIAH